MKPTDPHSAPGRSKSPANRPSRRDDRPDLREASSGRRVKRSPRPPALIDSEAPPLTERLAALSEQIRLRLLRLLERDELSVGEVAKVVQLPQSTVSRHLKLLADAGWLMRRAEGTASYYRLLHDDLPAESRELWNTVRRQFADSAQLREDDRRLDSVLAERSADSMAFFGRVAGEWDAIRVDLFGPDFTPRALLGLIPHEWTVADLGCGTGNIAELLAPLVRHVIAVDQSAPMIKAAKKRLRGHKNVEFVRGDLLALPQEDASVDAATCALVLHHLDDPAGALAEMRRIVRPGGTALIIDMQEHDRTVYRATMGHKRLGFSEEEIDSLLEDAGFESRRVIPMPDSAEGKGPGLFIATGRAPDTPDTKTRKD